MRRFRMTLLAVCLVLAWLGYHDLTLYFRNPEPLPIAIDELERGGAPREWLRIEGGTFDLERAINPSGRLETFEDGPFFVPLTSGPAQEEIRVVVETRRPEVISTLKTYVLDFDTVERQQAFVDNNRDAFHPEVTVTGMTASWLTSTANRDKLLQLAREQEMPVSDDVIFVSEGKEPGRFRGFFFSIVALLGILKFVQLTVQKKSGLAVKLPEEDT